MKNLIWDNIQQQSDTILSCGLNELNNQSFYDWNNITESGCGNYLISLDGVPYYIGEGKELGKRLKQQFKPTTSTFYKSLLKKASNNQLIESIPIDSFKIQWMPTSIGRKEVEEFGIVNLPTKLNSFQLGKRNKCTIAGQNGLWNEVQQNAFDLLREGESRILNIAFSSWMDTRIGNSAGLYLVKDQSDELIYVGESSDIGERIITHSGQTYFSALRRNVGRSILGFHLQEINGKGRYFNPTEDRAVTEFLKSCKTAVFPVSFGRFELEEYLINKYQPFLNRKGNKSNRTIRI